VKATVLVRPKEGILDPQGQAVEQSLRKLGFAVGHARIGRVVDLDVEASSAAEARERVDEMCRQLLANPLIESYDVVVHG
jgi:phosphoribosylformylglycinamidine synthase PurS subunit